MLDKEEKVRVGVIKVLMETAQDNIKVLPEMVSVHVYEECVQRCYSIVLQLIDDMVGRLRDKSVSVSCVLYCIRTTFSMCIMQWTVRKEAMIGLAKLYRKLMSSSSSSAIELKPSLIR